jgi:pyruvate kinase
MKNIIESIEPSVDAEINLKLPLEEPKAKMLRSAARLSQSLGDSAIIVFTRSGFLGYTLGALRPRGVPIFAFTDVEPLFRQLLLPWGVEPFLMKFSDDPEETILNALQILGKGGWVKSGAMTVVITNVLARGEIIDALQLRRAP